MQTAPASAVGTTLSVRIPVGVSAAVTVPALGCAAAKLDVTEGAFTVWNASGFVSGDAGVESASATADGATFVVQSGHYSFRTACRA